MAITSLRNEGPGWGGFFRPLTNLWRRVGRRRNMQPINLWDDDPVMREAVWAVRMAANLGEDYDKVSERIEREAARYREFLRNPTLIGEIILNAKQVLTDAPSGDIFGRVYQVRDPAEGQTSVVYNFKRSAGIVLEFVVHDQQGAPLFAIVRTYSDWLGERTFDLGAGRTFDLKMTEGECPMEVRVQASFVTARATAAAGYRTRAAACGLPLAADGGGTTKADGASSWSYGGPAYAFGMAALFLIAIGWAFRPEAQSYRPHAPTRVRAATGGSTVFTTYAEGETVNSNYARLAAADVATTAGWQESVYPAHSARGVGRAQQQQNDNRRTVTRIAAVTGGRVKMDAGFCRQVGALCDKWRADIQSTLDAVKSMREPAANTTDEFGSGGRPDPMMLSYLTDDAAPGHVHVTLLTADALYLIRGAGCAEFDGSVEKSFADATDPTPLLTGSGICGVSKGNEQQTGESNTATAEKRVKTLTAE
jgi:hypothetical protein